MNILNRCLVSLFTCALVTCSITFTSCDRRDITYYMESEINVIADWSNSGLDDEEAAHGATPFSIGRRTAPITRPFP